MEIRENFVLFPTPLLSPWPIKTLKIDRINIISSTFFSYSMGCTLHDHGHSHGNHNHSHSHSHDKSDDLDAEMGHLPQNLNVRAAFIHVVSDFVQSCGVFIASLVIFFKPEWSIIDPICTFLFSVLVLFTTLNIMKDALLVSSEADSYHYPQFFIHWTLLPLPWKIYTFSFCACCCSRRGAPKSFQLI